MAHILNAIHDPSIRSLLTDVLADEGHAVTVLQDFWAGLGVLRSALHGLVVLYPLDGSLGLLSEEQWAALEASVGELRRHEYIQLTWWPGSPTGRLGRLREHVHVRTISAPCDLEQLLTLVDHAAARLAVPRHLLMDPSGTRFLAEEIEWTAEDEAAANRAQAERLARWKREGRDPFSHESP